MSVGGHTNHNGVRRGLVSPRPPARSAVCTSPGVASPRPPACSAVRASPLMSPQLVSADKEGLVDALVAVECGTLGEALPALHADVGLVAMSLRPVTLQLGPVAAALPALRAG